MKNPHSLECGTFTMDIDDFDASCCTQTEHNFDIFDSFRSSSDDDKNISTKIINHKFDLNITSQKDINGSICLRIESDQKSSDWVKEDFNKTKIITISDSNVSFITKEANIFLKYKSDTNSSDINCSDALDGNSSSEDYFAIIPTRFLLDVNGTTTDIKIKAGEDYNLTIKAVDDDNNTITTYKQGFVVGGTDKNVSLFFDSIKSGNLELNTTYDFDINGTGVKTDFNISDVGEYIVKIIDTDYSNIDADDTNESNRTIEGNITIVVNPYLFDLNVTKHASSTGSDWAYMSQEKNESAWQNDMNYTIEATLTARNKQKEITTKFDKDEYANDVNTTVNFDTNLSSTDEAKIYKQFDGDFNITTGKFNTTKNTFIKGVSQISLVYRMDKNTSKAFRPIRTRIKDFNLTGIGDSEKNITKVDDNITWYYSKVNTHDIHTTKGTVTNNFFITVYKEDTKNFKEISLNWFLNANDNTSFSDDDFNASKNSALDSTSDSNDDVTYNKNENGVVDFNITKQDDAKAVIHINIPPYLWYSYGVDINYRYGSGTNCASHPCFEYLFKSDSSSGKGIVSGDYNGTDYNVSSRGDYKKLGIKVYR